MKSFVIATFLAVMCLGVSPATAQAAAPVGYILGITDFRVTGYAYDPDDPTAKVRIEVYSEDYPIGPVVGPAAYRCEGSTSACPGNETNPNDPLNWTGFNMQFRRVVDDHSGVAVLAVSATGSTWLTRALEPGEGANTWHRATDPFYYENANYKIGISRNWGASVFEYFNLESDAPFADVTNLVDANPGAAFQTALFGDTEHDVYPAAACLGSANDPRWWNPTQAGNYCSGFSGGSKVVNCQSSIPSWCTNAFGASNGINEASPSSNWIAFTVHYRNFYYEAESDPADYVPYHHYDDLYGLVTYTFKADYAQVDYKIWKAPMPVSYGAGSVLLPVAYLKQLTKFTTSETSIIRDPNSTTDMAPAIVSSGNYYYDITSSTGRWITGEAVDNRQNILPVPSPDNHVTFAFYSSAYRGNCPPRIFQIDYGPQDQGTVVQNGLVFEMLPGSVVQARALIFPYRHDDSIGGSTVSALIDGALMPSWECNQSSSPAGQGVPDPQTFDGTWPGGFEFGQSGDVPLTAKPTADQITGISPGTYPMVFRPGGLWIINNPGFTNWNGNTTNFWFGLSDDEAFVSSLAGNDVGWCNVLECPIVYRPSNGNWYVHGKYQDYSSVSNNPAPIQFGGFSGDIPMIVPMHDGNHIAVYRPGVGIIVNTNNRTWQYATYETWQIPPAPE